MINRHCFWLSALLLLGTVHTALASSFPVKQFVIEGNTLLGAEQLSPLLDSLLGETRTIEDLLAARERIETAYRQAGYGLVSIGLPRAINADGTVRLQVRELPLNGIAISPEPLDVERYRAALPSLQQGESPNLFKLARELNLANENPSHAVTVDFTQKDEGIVVEVRVEESSALKLSLTLDNTGTPETGRARSGVILQHANVFGLDHQALLAYTTAPDNASQVSIVGLNYQIPLPALGDSLVFSANYSNVDSGVVADFFNVSGQGYGYGAHYVHNLTRGADSRAALDFGIDRRVYRDVIDFSGTDLGNRISSLPLSLQFSTSGRLGRNSYAATLSGARNLPGNGPNNDAAYAAVRFGATANWSVLRASLRWSHALADNSQISLRGELQHSNTPLISGEQFGLGGSRSVRGLVERRTAGDRGWLSSIEWLSPVLDERHRFALFVDAGHVDRLNTPGASGSNAASWGVGWRLAGWKGLSVHLDVAQVLHGVEKSEKGGHRGHLAAVWSL